MGKFIKEGSHVKTARGGILRAFIKALTTKSAKEAIKQVATVSTVVGVPYVATKVFAPDPIAVVNEEQAKKLEARGQIDGRGQDVEVDPFVQTEVKPNMYTNFNEDPADSTRVDPRNEMDNIIIQPSSDLYFNDKDSSDYKEYKRQMDELMKKEMKKKGSFWPNSLYKLAQKSVKEETKAKDRIEETPTYISPVWKHRPGSKRFNQVLESMKLDPNNYNIALADTIRYNTGPNLSGMDITHFAIPKDTKDSAVFQNKWSENIDGKVGPEVVQKYLNEHINEYKRPLKEEPISETEGPSKTTKEKK